MYKVIIVDDEEDIRQGLSRMVDWSSIGFEVAALLEDGREAMEYISKNHVDAVLTDVTMTFVSGLELAKYVHENRFQTKVVLISGYKEFEYAKQAISYDVVHYLLKPTRLDEVEQVFRKIKEQLDADRDDEMRLEKINRHYGKIIPYLQEQFFNDIVMGALCSRDEINKRIDIIGLNIEPQTSKCCIIYVNILNYDQYLNHTWEYGKEGLSTAVRNIIRSTDGDILYSFISNKDGKMQILALSLSYIEKENLIEVVHRHFNNAKSHMKRLLGVDITYEIQGTFDSLYKLAENSRYDANASDVMEMPEASGRQELERMIEQQKLLVTYLISGNMDAVNNLLDTILTALDGKNIAIVHNFVISLFAMLENKLNDLSKNIGLSVHGLFNFRAVLEQESMEQLSAWCKARLNVISEKILAYRESSETDVIQKAMEYIGNNLGNGFSLEDVSDYVFLSPVYLSRMFKQKTGENFIDYLIKTRMEKAIEILGDRKYKVFEVSKMVGYNSTKYFFKSFKQYTGYTPTEYRNKILNGGFQ